MTTQEKKYIGERTARNIKNHIDLPYYVKAQIAFAILYWEEQAINPHAVADVLYWCTNGFEEKTIFKISEWLRFGKYKDSVGVLCECTIIERTIGYHPSSVPWEIFEQMCNAWNGKIQREEKYMLPHDRGLLSVAQTEAKRHISNGDAFKAIGIIEPIYNRYVEINRYIKAVSNIRRFITQSKLPYAYIFNTIIGYLDNEENRKYLHNNGIFPIDMNDLSYITDFCTFYETEMLAYKMLYGDKESKESHLGLGQLSKLSTDREWKYYQRAIDTGYAQEIEDGFLWLKKPVQLGYFLYKVYDKSICQSEQRPKSKLESLWYIEEHNKEGSNVEKVKSLSTHISRGAQKAEREDVKQWRIKIDEKIFFD